MPRARIPPPWQPLQRKIASRHARFIRASLTLAPTEPPFLPRSRYRADRTELARIMQTWAEAPPLTTRKRAILAMLDKRQ